MRFVKLWSGVGHSSTVYFFSLVVTLVAVFSSPLAAQTPCGCTNCPQFMPDGFTGSFLINVQNASNPILGQNGQGVCGITMHIEHEYIGDLRITLTSPSGQQVTLIGPIGFFGGTDFTDWNITFVPCTDPATPDPGFSATWNNNQPWGLNGVYTGSYYPSIGCLNNLTGPVNGTWTLTVTDGQAIDVGTFFDYDIIFCDPSGIDCFTCAANAGNLLQPDVVSCEGAANLDLNLPPTWTPASAQPPASDYSYTYVIAGPGGVIQAFDPSADLTSYSSGTYTVCGMSYLTAQSALIPEPNGSLTITQLSNQLNSGTAPFCGKITTNCVNVTINPAPEDIEQYEEICAPACFNFFNVNYCTSGTYVRNLTQAGCPYTATLHLTVHPSRVTNLTETICDGGCVTNPAFPGVCDPGSYTEVLQTVYGCDSTVNLNVVLLNVTANIQPPPSLPCTGGTVQLSGSGSSPGVSFQWTASNGGNIVGNANTQNVNVNAAGDYQLRVCRAQGGIVCCDSITTTVISDTDPPPSPTQINGQLTPCQGQAYNYNVPPVPGATSYTWTVPSGVTINSGGTGTTANITWGTAASGDICVTANNACGPSAPTCITIDPDAVPVVTQPSGPITACVGAVTTYSIPVVDNATSYTWTVPSGSVITGGQGSETIDVQWNNATGGNICVRASNACGQSTQQCLAVTVSAAPAAPNVTGPTTACTGTNSTYNFPALATATSYTWAITGGTVVSGGTSSSTSAQINWNAGSTAGEVCVTANNACGDGPTTCVNVTLSSPVATPAVTGQNAVCAGTTGVVYSISAVAGATGYTWSVPAGATIASGQNTTSITVNWAANAAPGGSICVSANASCGASPQACFPVTVSAVPNSVAGTDQDLCGTTTTLAATPSVGTGQWTTVGGPGTATFTNPTAANSGVTVSATGAYTFQWTETNGGTCTDNDVVAIDFNPSPTAGVIALDCDGANENYTVSFPITGGTAPYTVAGGTVSNGVFTSSPIPSGTPYTFVVDDANGCQSGVINGVFNCNCATNAGTMTLTLLEACEGQTVAAQHNGNATLDANDVGVYVLHSGSGTSVTTPLAQNTTGVFGFVAGMTYEQTYYVSYVVGNNVAGSPSATDPCLSVAQGQPVVFHRNPTPDAGVDLDTCGLTLNLNGSTGGVGAGAWSVGTTPSGGTLNISNQTSATTGVTADVFGQYTLVWTVDNSGCTATDQVVLTFNGAPSAGQISSLCNNTNTAYTVTIPLTGGTAPYSVNGQAVSGNSFISTAITSGTPYNFVITDANGCASPAITGTVNCDCATNAGTMTLTALSACEGGSITAQHNGGTETLDGDDVTAYVLHTGSGTTIVDPIAANATGTFSFQAGMTYGQTYYVSFVVGSDTDGNGAPDPLDPCLSVAQGQPVTFYQNPVPNPGPDQDVCGQTLNLAAIGSGLWSAQSSPIGGSLTISDPADPATAVTASVPGVYTLTWTVTTNGCTGTAQVDATFNDNPALVDLVRTCDGPNENFTVTLTLSGGTAPYSVNSTTVSGTTFTSSPLTNGASYSFTVVDANGCTMPAVTGAYSCSCATNAGTMAAEPLTACESATVTASANNDATLDANDVLAYVLHTGTGPALGTVIAQNTTGTFGFNSATMSYGVTYYISRIVGNPLGNQPNPQDPCFSVAIGQPVTFLQNPVPDAGVAIQGCGNTLTLAAVQGSFAGQWTLVTPAPGTASFAVGTAANSDVTVSQSGVYTFQWTETNGTCVGSDVVEATFNAIPSVTAVDETCNSTNTQYNVTVQVSGGTAPYTMTGLSGSFSGATFNSAGINSTTGYSFTVTDANGCTAGPITGSKNCNCATDAGSMLTATLTFCADQPAIATWNNDANLDGDDAVQFILHTQAGSSAGQVLATAATPEFNFGAGLALNTTYYISAIAGNSTGGVVDLNDDCLSVAPGTPVRWKPLPTATLTGDATLCAGDGATLTFGGTGTFPLTLFYETSTGDSASVVVAGAQGATLELTPDATITYSLTRVTDGTLPACVVAETDAVTLTVNQPVEAGTATLELDICAEEGTIVKLADLLTNADPGGQWIDVSVNPVLTGTFDPATGNFNTTGQQPGKYEFRYQVAGLAPCPSDEVVATVNVRPQPVANAGQDKTINCVTLEVELGGGSTSSGQGITYLWSSGSSSVTLPATRNITTADGGTYELLVTNSFGCTATDEVVVSVNNDVPTIEALAVRDIRCFGEQNGSISVGNVTGGTEPFEFSLNGASFTPTSAWLALGPGMYSVEVLDANGCSSVADSLVIAEPVQLVADLGADVAIQLGDSATATVTLNVPETQLDTIVWTPLIDPTRAGTTSQQFFPLHTNLLEVKIVDTSGCTATDRIYFLVDTRRHIYVPNIFQPSSSENNVVTVFGGNDVAEIELFQVFDRWGDQVHQASNFAPNDLTKGWTGRFGDREMQPAVYVWTVVALFKDGEREVFSGDVTLMR